RAEVFGHRLGPAIQPLSPLLWPGVNEISFYALKCRFNVAIMLLSNARQIIFHRLCVCHTSSYRRPRRAANNAAADFTEWSLFNFSFRPRSAYSESLARSELEPGRCTVGTGRLIFCCTPRCASLKRAASAKICWPAKLRSCGFELYCCW